MDDGVEGLPGAKEDQLRMCRGRHPAGQSGGLAAEGEVGPRRGVGGGRVERCPADHLQAIRAGDQRQRGPVVPRGERGLAPRGGGAADIEIGQRQPIGGERLRCAPKRIGIRERGGAALRGVNRRMQRRLVRACQQHAPQDGERPRLAR